MKRPLNIFLLILVAAVAENCSENQYYTPKDINDLSEKYREDSGQEIHLEDKMRIGEYTRTDGQIFCGEIACNVNPMKLVDTSSFTIIAGSDYAIDKHHVYYPLSVVCVDSEDCGVCYCSKYIIEGLRSDEFIYLGKGYARSTNNVYYRGEKISGIDVNTFKVIRSPALCYVGKDSNYVFVHGKKIEKIEPDNFHYLDTVRNEIEGIWGEYFFSDGVSTWILIPPNRLKKVDK